MAIRVISDTKGTTPVARVLLKVKMTNRVQAVILA